MSPSTLFLGAAVVLFTWAGIGCLLGMARFRYPPLLMLGAGYLLWVGSVVLLLAARRGPPQPAALALSVICLVAGAVCIFGYRVKLYPKMKARGITPKRLFGFGSSSTTTGKRPAPGA